MTTPSDATPSTSQPSRVELQQRLQRSERKFELMVAGIAAVAALIGAAIGGGVTYFANKQQIDAAAEQSYDTFLRAERNRSYVQLLRTHREVEITARKESRSMISIPRALTSREVAAVRERVAQGRRKMESHSTDVAIIGTQEAMNAAQELAEEHSNLEVALLAIAHTQGERRDAAYDRFKEVRNHVNGSGDRFLKVVRRNLGADEPID